MQQKQEQKKIKPQLPEQPTLIRPTPINKKDNIKIPKNEETIKVSNNITNLKNKMKTMNIDVQSDNIKIKKLEKENKELKEMIENENSKLNELKNQITSEFDLLEIRNNEISKKTEEFELKEIEITKKNNELNQQLLKHDYLFRSNYLQLEISNIYNNTYKWKLPKPITNVIGIKLMSYSLPQSRFNINKYNNTISFKINENIINVNINQGKYTIDEIISTLNTKLTDIKLSINNQQNIIIESENNFELIETVMSKEVLGFISECINNNKYTSDNTWDLRINDKVYLYLTNLSDNPLGVLYFNGLSDIQFKFQEPFDLDLLDITFKDTKGREYDFNNLSHSLSFLIEKIN